MHTQCLQVSLSPLSLQLRHGAGKGSGEADVHGKCVCGGRYDFPQFFAAQTLNQLLSLMLLLVRKKHVVNESTCSTPVCLDWC